MPYTKSQLDKMFAELPDDVKDAMTSVDTVDVLKGIQEKYHFHIDQVGDLSAEVGMLMLGATPPQKFISIVEKTLNIPAPTAKEIAGIINEKIFKNVRHSLMEIHKMTAEANSAEEKKLEIKPEQAPAEINKPVDPYKEAI